MGALRVRESGERPFTEPQAAHHRQRQSGEPLAALDSHAPASGATPHEVRSSRGFSPGPTNGGLSAPVKSSPALLPIGDIALFLATRGPFPLPRLMARTSLNKRVSMEFARISITRELLPRVVLVFPRVLPCAHYDDVTSRLAGSGQWSALARVRWGNASHTRPGRRPGNLRLGALRVRESGERSSAHLRAASPHYEATRRGRCRAFHRFGKKRPATAVTPSRDTATGGSAAGPTNGGASGAAESSPAPPSQTI